MKLRLLVLALALLGVGFALGRWALLALGAWIAGYGLWLLYRSVAKEPEKRLRASVLIRATEDSLPIATARVRQ